LQAESLARDEFLEQCKVEARRLSTQDRRRASTSRDNDAEDELRDLLE